MKHRLISLGNAVRARLFKLDSSSNPGAPEARKRLTRLMKETGRQESATPSNELTKATYRPPRKKTR